MLWKYDIHSEALKEPAFSCINFKISINKMSQFIFFLKSRLSYMSEKQIYGYKRVQDITSINFFSPSNFTELHMALSQFEVIASYVANLKIKLKCKFWQ